MNSGNRVVALIAIVFVGFILAGVFLNLFYAVCCFFTIFLLGIKNETFHQFQYWFCLFGGFAASFFLMRKAWMTTLPARRTVKSEPVNDKTAESGRPDDAGEHGTKQPNRP